MSVNELTVDLAGLVAGQPQVWRGIRIVPLLRQNPITDLRLDERCYDNDYAWIELPDRTTYVSYIPHAFVARWTKTGDPVPSLGTQMATKTTDINALNLRIDRKMARREARKQMRFLPLHTAMEGYLALHFNGPPSDNHDYTRRARTFGLSPRYEYTVPAPWIPGLEEAVKKFEIGDQQVGALYFVADAFAAAFVVPHPDDYRQLHRSVLMDFFGELLHQYGCAYDSVGSLSVRFDHKRIQTLDDIEKELERVRTEWHDLLAVMTAGLTHRVSQAQRVYKMGRHTLYRFLPEFKPGQENHIGEIIRAQGGETAYLKTMRLSEAQTKRGYLLATLARHLWDLDLCAESLGQKVGELKQRLERSGFDDLLEEHARRW